MEFVCHSFGSEQHYILALQHNNVCLLVTKEQQSRELNLPNSEHVTSTKTMVFKQFPSSPPSLPKSVTQLQNHLHFFRTHSLHLVRTLIKDKVFRENQNSSISYALSLVTAQQKLPCKKTICNLSHSQLFSLFLTPEQPPMPRQFQHHTKLQMLP